MASTFFADDRGLAAFGDTLVVDTGDLVFTAPCRPASRATNELSASATEQAIEACNNAVLAVEQSGAQSADIVRLRFWISSQAIADQIKPAVLTLFPDRQSRPAFSFIATKHEPGVHVFVEALAVRSGSRISIYRAGDKEGNVPGACLKGNIFCTGNLSGADGLATSGAINTPAEQARRAFEQLDDVLAQAKLSQKNVAHMMVWYRDHSFRDVVNGPFVERYPTLGDRPARHSLVRELPDGVGMQLEALAVVGERRFTYSVPGCYHHGIQHIPNSLPFATRVGNLLHTAATYGHVVDDGSKGGDLDEQCDVAFRHSSAALESAGMSMKDVTHVYVWIADQRGSEAVSRAWARHFGSDVYGPVRHDIVSPLPTIETGPFLVQLELTAVRT